MDIHFSLPVMSAFWAVLDEDDDRRLEVRAGRPTHREQ
jgi:hypothetical protein